jgi:hypothetical protein
MDRARTRRSWSVSADRSGAPARVTAHDISPRRTVTALRNHGPTPKIDRRTICPIGRKEPPLLNYAPAHNFGTHQGKSASPARVRLRHKRESDRVAQPRQTAPHAQVRARRPTAPHCAARAGQSASPNRATLRHTRRSKRVAQPRHTAPHAQVKARRQPRQTAPPPPSRRRWWSTAAGAAATAATALGRGRGGGGATAGDGDGGQQLDRVAVALRAGGGRGRLAHRAADLERVATGAAPELVTRHWQRVGPGSDRNTRGGPTQP